MNTLTIAATLGLISAGTATAQQSSATAASVPVTVDIVAAIAIVDTGALSFGQIVSGESAGAVTLTPLNERSATGGATLANGTGVRPATFEVTGAGSNTFAIAIPSLPVTITNGSATMEVDLFATPSPTLALLGGARTFAVGATLRVGAKQAAGHYAGTFHVSVAYD